MPFAGYGEKRLTALLLIHTPRSCDGPGGAGSAPIPPINTRLEMLATLAASGILAALLARLRVPAGALLGAMIAREIRYATGLVDGRFPPPLVVSGFVATGVAIGARFHGPRKALEGVEVVVDVTNWPSLEDAAALHFFKTSGRNLLAAEAAAGVGHHVALSEVGTDRLQESESLGAKKAQEVLIRACTASRHGGTGRDLDPMFAG